MKTILKSICLVCIFLFAGNSIHAQSGEQRVYIGAGMGLDYGGLIGAKLEYLPIKHFGVFGGVGYNLMSVGWNAGATFKILPDKKISPNLMAFYGYNGVLKVEGASQYDMTSYGITFGANLDIALGSRNKMSVGFFVPIRSKKFMDNYDVVKDHPNIEMKSELLPIAISIGFNFRL